MIEPARLPPPVGPGDTVGIAALSGPIAPDRLAAGEAALEAMGFRVRSADNLGRRHGLFAGNDGDRLAAFHALAGDPEVKAILFARGGWGVNRILGELDWPLLARYPRAYVGYSDLTPFLLQVVERLGLVSFHGPMVAADLARGLGPEEQQSLLDALAGRLPMVAPLDWVEAAPEGDAQPPAGMPTEGPLLGGCLSLIVSLIGTPYMPDLEGSLLFLEDLDEPPYRFDRMLTHLRLSGTLAKIRGLVIGHLRAEGRREPTAHDGEITLAKILRELAADYPWPLATGLAAGHASPNLTLPLGALARLDRGAAELHSGIDPRPNSKKESPNTDV